MSWVSNLLATPLGALMRLCYSVVRNYGLTIILFTFFTKVILFPVQLLVQKNSIKMVRMEPELHALKMKFIDNKDAYLDAQIALYKKEKYHPMAGTVPLLIQIPIIFGLIDVIYQPLTHILHLDGSLIELFIRKAQEVLGDLGSSPQLKVSELIVSEGRPDLFLSLGGSDVSSAVQAIQSLDTRFLGIDLARTPSIAHPDLLWLIPVLAGLSALLMCWIQNRINVLQIEQNRLSQWGMTIFMIAFSTFFAFLVPAGVGLYWIAGNLFAIPSMYLLNLIMNPKKYIDYEQMEVLKKISREQEEKIRLHSDRAKKDYKRFFARGNAESMRLMIYSEQSGFYKYFQNIIEALLKKSSDLVIHYVTSDPDDAVFRMNNPRIVPYYIDEKRLIPLMMKVEADIVLMTVPDLEKYHIKRSKVRKDVEYIFTDHGGTSLNILYREGALDYFDTIFACNESQVREIRQMEDLRHTKRKTIVECGYGTLDNMIATYQQHGIVKNEPPVILIAPSWQEDNILDSCIDQILDRLIGTRFRVIVRPHPQYIRRFPVQMNALLDRYKEKLSDQFQIEMDFSSNVTVYTADLVMTDWSAIGYEFCFATDKPALFINTKMKEVNPNWKAIEEVPFDISARNLVGRAVDLSDLGQIDQIVQDLLEHQEAYSLKIREFKNRFFFNLGHSGEVGADYILYRLSKKHPAG